MIHPGQTNMHWLLPRWKSPGYWINFTAELIFAVFLFRIFMIIAWAVLLVLLLYLWADVREIAGIVKENKRELLRSSLNTRASESFPNFQEEEQRAARQPQEDGEKQPQKTALSASEEQVLNEVLTEFLG